MDKVEDHKVFKEEELVTREVVKGDKVELVKEDQQKFNRGD